MLSESLMKYNNFTRLNQSWGGGAYTSFLYIYIYQTIISSNCNDLLIIICYTLCITCLRLLVVMVVVVVVIWIACRLILSLHINSFFFYQSMYWVVLLPLLSWICTIVYWGESRWERPEKTFTQEKKKEKKVLIKPGHVIDQASYYVYHVNLLILKPRKNWDLLWRRQKRYFNNK